MSKALTFQAQKVGDRVTVKVAFDAEYTTGPQHPMPDWFAIPLNQHPQAKQGWDNLIPSRKKEILRYFSWLKSDEARQRNLAKVLEALSGKETRFMARTWKDGK